MLKAADSDSTTVGQLVELNLYILLGRIPFNISRADFEIQHRRFLKIWSGEHEQDVAPEKSTTHREENKQGKETEKGKDIMTAAAGLSYLAGTRLNFQRLGDSGFRFVSELLLVCLQKLSPEGTSGNFGIRGWVVAHGHAVEVLSELLSDVPLANWASLDEQAERTFPVWQCLQLLTSGATWWGGESGPYRENMLRLAMCICASSSSRHFCLFLKNWLR